MSLSAPAMDSGASGEAWLATIRSARALVSCWPTLDFTLLIRDAQETAEVGVVTPGRSVLVLEWD